MTIYEKRNEIRINDYITFNYAEIDNTTLEQAKLIISQNDDEVLKSNIFPKLPPSTKPELINISSSGMGFHSENKMDTNSFIAITMKFGNEGPIYIAGTIVESDQKGWDQYYIHVHFTYISIKNREILRNVIKNKLSD